MFGYVANMNEKTSEPTEKHDRLRHARVRAKFKYASDAAHALGIAPSTYRAHENGQNDFSLEEAQAYGKKFNTDPLWIMGLEVHHIKPLMEGGSTSPDNLVVLSSAEHRAAHLPNATIGAKLSGRGPMIKVYGRAVGGVDGEFEMNGSVLYEVMAPPILSDISGAYAVQVSGDSMSPRYEDGEICFVDPNRRVKRGDYVIAQIRLEEHGPLLAYVKKFVRHNAAELVLEQFNPAKELTFDARCVHSVDYIALAGNA